MNAAEIDIKRRALGLSIPETAKVLGISRRQLEYWFAGNNEPRNPGGIAERLIEVEVVMGDLVDDVAERAADAAAETIRPAIVLKRYRDREALEASGEGRGLPLGAYLMALSWTIEDLRADGHAVTVEWTG